MKNFHAVLWVCLLSLFVTPSWAEEDDFVPPTVVPDLTLPVPPAAQAEIDRLIDDTNGYFRTLWNPGIFSIRISKAHRRLMRTVVRTTDAIASQFPNDPGMVRSLMSTLASHLNKHAPYELKSVLAKVSRQMELSRARESRWVTVNYTARWWAMPAVANVMLMFPVALSYFTTGSVRGWENVMALDLILSVPWLLVMAFEFRQDHLDRDQAHADDRVSFAAAFAKLFQPECEELVAGAAEKQTDILPFEP